MNLKFTGSLDRPDFASIGIIGVPLDENSSFRRGSRLAPNSIRRASHELETFHWNRKIELTDIGYFDFGDISFCSYQELFKSLESFNLSRKIFLGGDHSISLPVVKQLREEYSDLLVISIDSHTDFRDDYCGNRFSNASVMKRISEVVGTDDLIEIGICSSSEEEYLEMKDSVKVLDLDMLRNLGLEEIVSEISTQGKIYLSIDIDSLDLASAYSVGNPEPDGMSISELIRLVARITNEMDVVACDIVEVNPLFGEETSFFAARITMELIGGWM
ncbi:MAG: agmatinase [Halobacteriota archaeon]|nr:agmatinase [Halobacteriota archaeon]